MYNSAMKYKFFTNSQKAWKAMFEAISGAKKSIFLEMYIFENNMRDFDFFSLLKEKSKQGVKVVIIIDSFGSSRLDSSAVRELDESGIEVLSLSYLLHRMHRKILVVDEHTAFIGGVNFHQTARFWNDLMVKITGNLVKKVVASFSKSYRNAGGLDEAILRKSSRTGEPQMNIGIVENSPYQKKFHLKKIYKKYLSEAKESIVLMTPYFIPKRWFRAALHQAVLRGVSVEALVPQKTDYFLIDRVNYFYVLKLSRLGIKFYIEKQMNHAKVIIIDGKEAMIGSQNMDFLSFDFNSEVGIFFKEKEAVDKLLRIAENWKKDAVLFDAKDQKPKWFDYVLAPLINFGSFFYRIFQD